MEAKKGQTVHKDEGARTDDQEKATPKEEEVKETKKPLIGDESVKAQIRDGAGSSARFQVNDGDLLIVVLFLKRIFGGNRDVMRLLKKIDTPSEVARIRDAVQHLIDLVSDL